MHQTWQSCSCLLHANNSNNSHGFRTRTRCAIGDVRAICSFARVVLQPLLCISSCNRFFKRKQFSALTEDVWRRLLSTADWSIFDCCALLWAHWATCKCLCMMEDWNPSATVFDATVKLSRCLASDALVHRIGYIVLWPSGVTVWPSLPWQPLDMTLFSTFLDFSLYTNTNHKYYDIFFGYILCSNVWFSSTLGLVLLIGHLSGMH